MTCPLISICLGHRIRRYELDLRTYFGTATRQLLREAPTGLNAVRGAMMESNKCQGAKTAIEDRADSSYALVVLSKLPKCFKSR